MDKNVRSVLDRHIERTIKALEANNISARFVETPQELCAQLADMLPEGAEIASGGSATLLETGVYDLLMDKKYRFYYRGYKDEQGNEVDVFRKAYYCDWFFMSSNAVTEEGELYNVDGNGNRVSALIHGPKHVVVIVGANKLVPDIAAADERVRRIAAPANCARLDKDSGCRKGGVCVNCKSPGRVCCTRVTTSFQGVKGRITVFILPESFGF